MKGKEEEGAEKEDEVEVEDPEPNVEEEVAVVDPNEGTEDPYDIPEEGGFEKENADVDCE